MKKLRLFIHPNLFLPAFAGSFFFKDMENGLYMKIIKKRKLVATNEAL